jgi:acetylglutamate kinase
MSDPIVIKVSGHELDDPAFLNEFAEAIYALTPGPTEDGRSKVGTPVVIVHGGGKEISALQQQMGIEPRYLDGVRITDGPSLALAEMVMAGTVNKRLVGTLVNAGVDAIGLSGVDLGIVRAEKMTHATQDMGFTGVVTVVRPEPLQALLDQGMTPVIAPICLGADSHFNVNADHVAGAIGAALEAERIIFMTNVEGVLVNNQVVERLTPEQVEAYIADGTIFGGMIPKVRTALEALGDGVAETVITNLKGLSTGGGTVFSVEGHL